MQRITIIAAFFLLIAAGSCGHGRKLISTTDNHPDVFAQPQALQPVVEWPSGLPVDKAQPWEKLDAAGRVVSSINLQSEFVPGVERFLEAGSVSDLGEASAFASGAPGGENVSWAIYRIPMGSEQPGTIACDANTRLNNNGEQSAYYIGVGDYSVNTWHWYGPFSVSHVRFNVPAAAYTSGLGNLMLAVVAYDGADFDLVGLGVNARDGADTTAPPVPSAPTLTPVAGGVLAEWIPVVAADLAGYRVYADGNNVFDYIEGGTSAFIPATADVSVTLSAIDVSGNESAQSAAANAAPLTGNIPVVELTASSASGQRGDIISLTASGADSYDWDTDGDGTWDITDDTTGSAFAVTTDMGIIRPALRAHAAGDGFWMGAVSLIIAGNSRPVAEAFVNPASGPAPLEVSFEGFGTDDDGTIGMYDWDFEGDGTYDYGSPTNGSPLYTYTTAGLYNAKLRVTDNEGSWDVDTVTVQVSPPLNSPPEVALSAGPTAGNAPLTVMLDATGSNDPDQPYGDYIARYEWDIEGDGGFDKTTYEPIYWFTYEEPGVYFTTLRVEDSRGGSAIMAVEIDVSVAGNDSPVAETVAYPVEGGPPLEVTFNADASYDPDGSIVLYEWDFNGDNAFEASGDSPIAMYTYTSWCYDVHLRVTDNDGAQAVETVPITLWTTKTVDGQLRMGWYASLAVINGNPMLAHYEVSDCDLWTIRATDIYGSTWFYNRSADRTGDVGEGCTLAEVNGRAAIAYTDNTNACLKYVRSTSENGYYWGAPVIVNAPFSDGGIDLQVVDGYPAIAYLNSTDGNVYYIRALDANGATWGTPVPLAASVTGYQDRVSLAVIDGNPAVAFADLSNFYIVYIRATDADGASWGSLVTVDSSGNCLGPDMALVDGQPAIAYCDAVNSRCYYVRAVDADGDSWDTPVVVSAFKDAGWALSMAVVGGRPAVSFQDYENMDLCFVHAVDTTGSSWNEPVVVDHIGNIGAYNSLAEVEGSPAIGYMDVTNGALKYAIRNVD